MYKIIKGKKISIILLVVGGIGGFIYWKYVGCLNGTCTIKSVWYWSTLWGAAVGFLLGDFISDAIERLERKKRKGDD